MKVGSNGFLTLHRKISQKVSDKLLLLCFYLLKAAGESSSKYFKCFQNFVFFDFSLAVKTKIDVAQCKCLIFTASNGNNLMRINLTLPEMVFYRKLKKVAKKLK